MVEVTANFFIIPYVVETDVAFDERANCVACTIGQKLPHNSVERAVERVQGSLAERRGCAALDAACAPRRPRRVGEGRTEPPARAPATGSTMAIGSVSDPSFSLSEKRPPAAIYRERQQTMLDDRAHPSAPVNAVTAWTIASQRRPSPVIASSRRA